MSIIIGYQQYNYDTSIKMLYNPSVYLASTTNVNLANIRAGSLIDNTAVRHNDRILLKNQINAIENGIYVITTYNVPARAKDLYDGTNASLTKILVSNGSLNSCTEWICSSKPGNDVVGVNDLTFVQNNIISYVTPISLGGTGLTSVIANKFLTTSNTNDIITSVSIPSGDIVGTTAVQNIINKTYNGIGFNAVGANPVALFAHSGSDTVVVTNFTQTISNKTLVSPILSGELIFNNTSIGSGIVIHRPVRCASTTNISSLVAGVVIDGITLVDGDRVLLKDQTNAVENGIYIVGVARATDFAVGYSAAAASVKVVSGNVNATAEYICVNSIGTDVVGTNALSFVISNVSKYIMPTLGSRIIGDTDVQTIYNKTLSNCTIANFSIGGTSLLPATNFVSLGDATHYWTQLYATMPELTLLDINYMKDTNPLNTADVAAFIEALTPISYNWKSPYLFDNNTHFGFSGNDVNSTIGSSKLTSHVLNLTGSMLVQKGANDYMMRYSEMFPLIINYVQNLKSQISTMQSQIATMQNQIAILQRKN